MFNFNIALVFLGVTLFGYSIFTLIRLLNLESNLPLRRWWVVLMSLVVLFCIGYIVFGYFLFSNSTFLTGTVMPSLVSLIFFFGAVFVVITISLFFSTVSDLREQSSETVETNKRLEEVKDSLESEVKKRTEQIERAKATLEEEVVKRTLELDEKVRQLEQANSTMVGRETAMAELKKENEELRRRIGQ